MRTEVPRTARTPAPLRDGSVCVLSRTTTWRSVTSAKMLPTKPAAAPVMVRSRISTGPGSAKISASRATGSPLPSIVFPNPLIVVLPVVTTSVPIVSVNVGPAARMISSGSKFPLAFARASRNVQSTSHDPSLWSSVVLTLMISAKEFIQPRIGGTIEGRRQDGRKRGPNPRAMAKIVAFCGCRGKRDETGKATSVSWSYKHEKLRLALGRDRAYLLLS